MRWSGQGAPIWLTSGARTDEAKATASGLRSTRRTAPGASASRAPRRIGSVAASRSSASSSSSGGAFGPPSPKRGPAARRIAFGGARDELERRGIALAARLAPGDETVLLEQHGARAGILAQELGNALRHGEAGALVVEPDGLGAERLVGEPPPFRAGGQGDDRVRVRVVDVRGADERVEERLDGRPRLRGHEGAAEEVVHHLGVLHLHALDQRQDLVEPERGEAFGRDRRQVGAGALDPEDARLAPEVVTRDPFGRRVSAALVGERSIGPEQVRAIDEAGERVEPGRGAGVPEIDRGLDATQGAGGLLHACTSSRSDSPLRS